MARSEGYAGVSKQASGDALYHLLNIQRRIFHLIFAEEDVRSFQPAVRKLEVTVDLRRAHRVFSRCA
jgi:myosin-crossreactive antigen